MPKYVNKINIFNKPLTTAKHVLQYTKETVFNKAGSFSMYINTRLIWYHYHEQINPFSMIYISTRLISQFPTWKTWNFVIYFSRLGKCLEFAQKVWKTWNCNSKPGKNLKFAISVFHYSLFKMLFTKQILIYIFIISTLSTQIDLGFHCFYLEISWKIHGILCHQRGANPGYWYFHLDQLSPFMHAIPQLYFSLPLFATVIFQDITYCYIHPTLAVILFNIFNIEKFNYLLVLLLNELK